MLHALPTELLWAILHYLEYEDIDTLLSIRQLECVVSTYLQQHYRFHYQVVSLLRLYESLASSERQKQDTRHDIAQQLLHLLCHHVQQCTKFEQRSKFTHLLDILQQLVVQRVLSPDLEKGLESDYASLCLDIRHIYLHTASIRGLHDPKYRRRSTKHPLAPFLPRDYTWIWRKHCALTNEWISQRIPSVDMLATSWASTLLPSLCSLTSQASKSLSTSSSTLASSPPSSPSSPSSALALSTSSASSLSSISTPTTPTAPAVPSSSSPSSFSTAASLHGLLLRRRKVCLQFARFFGMLFDITSLYLESNLDGTFEECVRESLVSGNVEGLLLLCISSDRPIDVESMCLSVSHAGEQLWNYLDTMDDWMTTNPTPEQLARQEQQQEEQTVAPSTSPPDWLMPDRYKIQADTKFRLKMMNHLYQKGWEWFQ